MAERLGEAIFEIKTDSSKFDQGIGSAETRTKGFGVVAAATAGLIGGTLVGALSDAARAAAEEEAVFARMDQSLRNAADGSRDWTASTNAAIAAAERLSFSDDQAAAAIQMLTDSTGSAEEAFKRLPIAMDLARAKHIPLEEASKRLGRVSDENTKALSRLGFVVRDGADATEVLGLVQARTANQAQIYADSTEGGMVRIRNAFDNLKEGIGGALGPFQGIVGMLPGMSVGFSAAASAASALGTATGRAKIEAAAHGAVSIMTSGLTKAWAATQWLLNAALSANPIGIIVLALAGLAVGLKVAYDNSETFRSAVGLVMNALGTLLSPLKFVWDALVSVGKAFGLIAPESQKMADESQADAAAMSTGVQASTTTMTTNVKAEVTKMADFVPAELKRMKDAGVGNAKAMEIDTILSALGMNTDVRAAVSAMVEGTAGMTAEQRETTIRDMQVAKLQATLRAAGMSEEVVASVDSMVFEAGKRTGGFSKQTSEHMREVHDRALEQADRMRGVGERFGEGLALGLDSQLVRVRNAAGRLALAVIDQTGRVLIEESPSKVAIGQGEMYGEGLAIGVTNKTGRVGAAVDAVVKGALSTAFAVLSTASTGLAAQQAVSKSIPNSGGLMMESGPGMMVNGQPVVLREAAVDKLTGAILRVTHVLQAGETMQSGDIPYTSVSGSVAAMIQAGFLPADYSPLGGYNGVPLPTPLAISAPSPLYTPGGAFTPSEPTTQTINLVVDGRVLASVVGARLNEQRRLSGAMA